MTKGFPVSVLGLLIIAGAAAAAVFIYEGTSSAQTEEAPPAAERKPALDPDAMLAVAIGTIQNGETDPTIDLRAHEADANEGGAFRFFCEDMGYYNGGVDDITFAGGVITATGSGALWKTDGTRVKVDFTLTVDTETSLVTVAITGPGVDYETSGLLDGFTWAGTRADAPPFAQ